MTSPTIATLTATLADPAAAPLLARAIDALTLATALAAGLVAGTFFAFSTFVMPALARLAPATGIAAMQAINVAAINRWFLGVLLGAAATCAVLAAAALLDWHAPGATTRLAGASVYIVGALGVTIARNVPRNEALGALAPDSPAALALWPDYLREWCAWNHVRTVASLAAAALLTLALP